MERILSLSFWNVRTEGASARVFLVPQGLNLGPWPGYNLLALLDR